MEEKELSPHTPRKKSRGMEEKSLTLLALSDVLREIGTYLGREELIGDARKVVVSMEKEIRECLDSLEYAHPKLKLIRREIGRSSNAEKEKGKLLLWDDSWKVDALMKFQLWNDSWRVDALTKLETMVKDLIGAAYSAKETIGDFLSTIKADTDWYDFHSRIFIENAENLRSKKLEMAKEELNYLLSTIEKNSSFPEFLLVDALSSPQYHYQDKSTYLPFGADEVRLIIELLDSRKRRSVVVVDGADGSGKTTLAKRVCHNKTITEHFQTCAWVNVPEDPYVPSKLLKKIIKGVLKLKEKEDLHDDYTGESELQSLLCELLNDRGRYLIVLDGMSSLRAWEMIDRAFPDGFNGSRVVITSRDCSEPFIDSKQSSHMSIVLDPRSLPCKELFLMKAYPSQNFKDVAEFGDGLKDSSEEILSNFKGTALELVMIGGLLSAEKDPESFLSKWRACESTERISFYYSELPSDLKSCLSCMSCFPLGSEISTKHLTRLWIAADLIPDGGSKPREEMAEGVLEELIKRCMVQVVKTRFDGRVKSVRIHRSLYKICRQHAPMYGILYNDNFEHASAEPSQVTCLALHNSTKYMGHYECRNLHTLLGFGLSRDKKNEITRNLRLNQHLRVLDLEGSFGFSKLPIEITDLHNLVYVRITDVTEIMITPLLLSNHDKLQTLDIKNGAQLLDSPESPSKMFSCSESLKVLRCISAGTWIQTDLPDMTTIQDLGIQDIRHTHENMLCRSLQKLDSLTSLSLISHKTIPVKVLEAIQKLKRLQQLRLKGRLSKPQGPSSSESPQLLTKLTDLDYIPQLHITKLTLEYTKLGEDPMTTLEKLPQLMYLKLYDKAYLGESMSCSADGFPQLRQLILDGLENWQQWELKTGAMPHLTALAINQCPALEMLPEGIQDLKELMEVQLLYMPLALKEGILKREEWKKIQHVPSIITNNL